VKKKIEIRKKGEAMAAAGMETKFFQGAKKGEKDKGVKN